MAITGNEWGNLVPEFRLIEMPYLFKNYKQANYILNSETGEKIYKNLDTYSQKLNPVINNFIKDDNILLEILNEIYEKGKSPSY